MWRCLMVLTLLWLNACASCPCEELGQRFAQCGIVLRETECSDAEARCAECVLEQLFEDCSNYGQICISECTIE